MDREKALAHEMLLKEQCPKCGTLAEDWVDEKGKPLAEPLMAAVNRHCFGCEEIEKIEEKRPKKAKGGYVAMIPFAYLTDEDDDWFNPNTDPDTLRLQAEEELSKARSLGG